MRTHVKQAQEETGKAPACTGALLEIKSIKPGAVKKADSEFVGCKQYTVQLQIKAPKGATGMTVFDRIRVGTPDDKDAVKKATWEVSEGGPARLRRLLTRSGTAITEDDEEWCADAAGRTVVAPITHRGEFVNVGLYYRETDKDCPVIGLAEGGKAAGPRRPRPTETDDEEDETATGKPAPVEVEDDDDEKPVKKPKKAAPVAEADDDEDDDEPAPKPAKKSKKPQPPDDDEDE